ncbi:MAG: hypothetical protein QNK92_04055 [Amylibacter sp.]
MKGFAMKNFWKLTQTLVISVLAIGLQTAQPHAQSNGITVELNKFEVSDTGGCRAFFLFRNQSDITFEGFEMSLAILDNTGVIDRLLSIDAAPISAARTTLKLFEISDISCPEISEILLHELPSCRPQNGEEMNCFPIITLHSRTSATLVK